MNALNQKIDDQLKTKDEKRKDEQKDKDDSKKAVADLRKGQEKLLDENDIKKMEAQKAKIPPYLENISRDLIINKKLKIMLEKSKKCFKFRINHDRKNWVHSSKRDYLRRPRYAAEAC